MDNIEPEGMRGDRRAPLQFFGGGFEPTLVSVSLRGRGRRVRRAVREGLRHSGVAAAEPHDFDRPAAILVKPLKLKRGGGGEVFPRRRDAKASDAYGGLPRIPRTVVKARFTPTVLRIFVYLYAALRWYARILWDWLRRRNTIERRAAHLREIIEGLGGIAIKIGQQVSLRMDLLPHEYGAEMEKMLERVPPFPTELAVARIEAVTGRPLEETFAEFNRTPAGSASVACVYEAVRKTGERVAVKVRRPGIKERFASDCKALEWVFKTLETLTILRDDYSKNLIAGLRTILLEETDFVKEARYTEIFRRRARKHLRRVSAPKIHFDLSGEDVIVQEFIEGVKMGDMIAFVEQKDEEALERLRQLDIDPEKVAKKLIRVNQYGVFENTLFHADPHPSNLIVRPHNHLVFIDFGAVGAYTTMERNNWRQLNYYHQRRDVGRMAQTALAILEPLPAVNIDELRERLEQVFWQDIYAHQSKHTEWYEHTSMRIWMHLFELTYEFNIPMGLNTLRMIRSTLLSETVAARLYPKVSAWREHRKYNRRAARRSRRRVLRSVFRRLCGPTDEDYQRIEQCKGIINRTIYLYQRWIDNPLYRYALLIKKAVYAFILVVRTVLRYLTIAAAVLLVYVVFDFAGQPENVSIGEYMRRPFIANTLNRLVNPTATPAAGVEGAGAAAAPAPAPQPAAAAQSSGAQPAPAAPGEVKAPSPWSYLPLRLFVIFFLVHTLLYMRRLLIRLKDRDIRRRNTSGLS
jgi:ubiquinone biosynthesis protein